MTGSAGGTIRAAAIAHAATQLTILTDMFLHCGRHRENMQIPHGRALDRVLNLAHSCCDAIMLTTMPPAHHSLYLNYVTLVFVSERIQTFLIFVQLASQ